MRAKQYLMDQLGEAIDNYPYAQRYEIAVEAMVKDPIARGYMVELILAEMTGDDRARLVSWGSLLPTSESQARDERDLEHWQIWTGLQGEWVTAGFLWRGTYGASLKAAPPGLKVIARYAPDECTAHLRCLRPSGADLNEDAYDEHIEAMDYDHLNDPGR